MTGDMAIRATKAATSLALCLALTGCATYDAQTIWTLNQRLLKIESGGVAKQGQPQPSQPAQRSGWSGQENYVYIYVPMLNGGQLPIKVIQRNTTVFEGPKGELYYSFPTVEQLRKEYVR